MHSLRFLLAALLGAVVAALLAVGPTGPATATTPVTPVTPVTAASTGSVGSGAELVTRGRSCTASFVFRDSRHRVYLGYAASCATRRPVHGAASCTARSLPLGTRVRIADQGRTIGFGRLAYSSLRALRAAGITDPATCAAEDFALVRVRGAARHLLSASVPYWGGPTGLGPLPAAGSTVFGLVRPQPSARTLPRAGAVTASTATTATVSTPLASTRTARGGGFLDDQGRAVGILITSTATGDNAVVGLADAVAFASTHGVRGLRLVQGHDAFSGTAIL